MTFPDYQYKANTSVMCTCTCVVSTVFIPALWVEWGCFSFFHFQIQNWVSEGPTEENAVCVNCQNNSVGDKCESCLSGYFLLQGKCDKWVMFAVQQSMDSHTVINITKPLYVIYKNIMLWNTINTFERHLYSRLIWLICDCDFIWGNSMEGHQ